MQIYYFELLLEDAVPWNIRSRIYDVTAFVCEELKHSSRPTVVWLRCVSQDQAIDILHRWRQNPENLIPGKRTPTISVSHEIKGGYTPSAFPNEIWVRSDLSKQDHFEYAVAHEIRHLWQKAKDISIFSDECRAEGDAYPYGYEVLKRYLASKGELKPEIDLEIDRRNDETRDTFQKCWPHGRYEVITS